MARSALRLSTHWLVTDLTIQALSKKFAQCLKTFFSPILKLYYLEKELVFTAGRTWHFQFKFVLPIQMPHRARFKFSTHGKAFLIEFSSFLGKDVSQMSVGCPGGGGLLKLRIDRCISSYSVILSELEPITRSLHTNCTLESTQSRIFLFLELRYVGGSLISRENTLTFA